MARAGRARLRAVAAITAAAVAFPLMLEARLDKPEQAVEADWKGLPIRRRGQTLLGTSFRPLQVEAFGLEARATLKTVLAFPFDIVRLAAYWNRIEGRSGQFDTSELDWQLDATERSGKQVILSVGPIKNFGYPEFFVPEHRLERPLREGSVVRPAAYAALLASASGFIRQIVDRYRNRSSIVAWQLEHEAADPLGVEHSWRLGADFIERELEALKEADPSRPVMMTGFLPTSSAVRLSQWWRTRDQGDSLAVAARLADIVGIDYYPRHALVNVGRRTLYLDGAGLPWQRTLTHALLQAIRQRGKRLMVSEGQAEPWEAITLPPNPEHRAMFSCRPGDTIRNYNAAMGWSDDESLLYAYLLWGPEYWVVRDRSGDSSYREAVGRILHEA